MDVGGSKGRGIVFPKSYWLVALLCLVIFALAAFFQNQKQDLTAQTYTIGYSNVSPLMEHHPGAQPSGFAVEVLNEAAGLANIRLKWVLIERGADFAMLEQKVDLWPYLHNKNHLRGKVDPRNP